MSTESEHWNMINLPTERAIALCQKSEVRRLLDPHTYNIEYLALFYVFATLAATRCIVAAID